ncbi:hypothetical protein pb186bvf_016675 [Paramecium bursaria]
MIKKLRIFKALDLFGVPYKTKISLQEQEQKSILGGLITAILYGVSFTYFIYVVIQWQTGNILPGTSSMSKAQTFSNYTFNKGELIEFCYWRYSPLLLDPFDPSNILLLPIGYKIQNGVQSDPVNLISVSNQTSRYKSLLISPENFTIQQNVNALITPEQPPDIQFAIILRSCDQSFLIKGQKCGSQEDIDKFWTSAANYISFWFKLRQFNILTKEIDVIEKQIYFPINNFSNTNGQILFKPVNLKVDDGILFQNKYSENFLTEIEIVTGQTSMDFLSTILGYNTYLSFFLKPNPIINDNKVTYPKLAQILAEVGSISSTLLMIRVVIILINEHILEERILKRIIRMQYPFLQFNKENQDIKNRLKAQAKQKLIITQIIHDIIKIQSFLEHRFGKSALQSVSNSRFSDSESSVMVRITPHKTVRYKSIG